MFRKILFLLLLIIPGAVHCQTLSPVIGEGGHGKINGQFTVTNNGIKPIVVTVEPVSFGLKASGSVVARVLDSNTEVKLGETSAKIGAQQAHTFDYSVRCNSSEPCTTALLASTVAGRTTEGLQMRIVLTHVLYICPTGGSKGCRARVRKAAGISE